MRHACRITPQFSGGALTYVPWHFMHDRPLQLLVMRLAKRERVRFNVHDHHDPNGPNYCQALASLARRSDHHQLD